jgi:hypothetical protein
VKPCRSWISFLKLSSEIDSVALIGSDRNFTAMYLIHGVYWHTVQFSARRSRHMRDTSSKEGRLRYAASSKSESKENFVGKACVPIIYLGNGAQDSGSPTCAPVPVSCQCDYGRRRASAKTSSAMSPMNVAYFPLSSYHRSPSLFPHSSIYQCFSFAFRRCDPRHERKMR